MAEESLEDGGLRRDLAFFYRLHRPTNSTGECLFLHGDAVFRGENGSHHVIIDQQHTASSPVLAKCSRARTPCSSRLSIASQRYKTGYSPFLDQLDAQRGLLSVQLAVTQTRADQLNAYVTLFQSLGGGWDRARIVSD